MTATDQAAPARPSRWRSVAAVICFVLAALLTVPASVAHWGQRTLNDTERYIQTVGPLIESPEVLAAISAQVNTAIQEQVDVEALLEEAFAGVIEDRPRLEMLIGPLAGAINGLIARTVDEVVRSDVFKELWVGINTKAQVALIKLLRGEEAGAVSIQGDQVVLDVGDVIEEVKQRLVARGLTALENAPIPDVDKQIVLLTAPQLQQARTIYALTNPVATWAIWVVIGLYLAAFLLARRRPPMSVAIGLAVAVDSALLLFALSVGRQLFVNELAGTIWGPASSVFYDTLLGFLVRGATSFIWIGVVLVVAGWFAGRNRSGAATRAFLAGALETPGRALADGPVGGVGRWVAGNAVWLRWVAIAIGWVVLVAPNDLTVSWLGWSVLLVIVLLAAIQVLVGAGTPAAPVEPGAPSVADAPAASDPSATKDTAVLTAPADPGPTG